MKNKKSHVIITCTEHDALLKAKDSNPISQLVYDSKKQTANLRNYKLILFWIVFTILAWQFFDLILSLLKK